MELVTPVSKCDDIGEWARGPASDCTSVLPALPAALLYPFQRTPNPKGLQKHGPQQLESPLRHISVLPNLSCLAVPGCISDACKSLNTWTAGLDVLYVLLVFLLVHEFRKYAVTLALIDGEVNVRVEDYSMELFGFQ